MGDIVVDSAAADGDAFPMKPSKKNIILKTASCGDMQHYGEKEVIFKHANGKGTDMKKPEAVGGEGQ
jgi:hypothetical protein